MKIESSQNQSFKNLLSLTKSKGLKEQQQCLVSGTKITQEISALQEISSFWIYSPKNKTHFCDQPKSIELNAKLFDQLDVCGTHQPLLCCNLPATKTLNELDHNSPVLYVALSDPTNLGALLRTCAAFGWQQIVLLKESAHAFLPKAIRAASGTCFSLSFFDGPSIHELNDPEIIALDMGGEALKKNHLKSNLKLLVGEEGQGVPISFLGQRVKIPISNKVESLNATIATSLVIYQWSLN